MPAPLTVVSWEISIPLLQQAEDADIRHSFGYVQRRSLSETILLSQKSNAPFIDTRTMPFLMGIPQTDHTEISLCQSKRNSSLLNIKTRRAGVEHKMKV
jgi:hypothetical protein